MYILSELQHQYYRVFTLSQFRSSYVMYIFSALIITYFLSNTLTVKHKSF